MPEAGRVEDNSATMRLRAISGGVGIMRNRTGWRTRVVLILAALLVVAAAIRGDYPAVWTAWWDGEPTEDLRMFSMEIVWWGRIGKGLQFLAGMVALLDFVDTDKLREQGAEARRTLERILRETGKAERETASVVPLMAMKSRTAKTFLRTESTLLAPFGGNQHSIDKITIAEPVVRVPAGVPLSLDAWIDLRRRFVDERDAHHRHKNHADVCDQQLTFLHRLVHERVLESLSAEDRELLQRAERKAQGIRNTPSRTLLALLIAVLIATRVFEIGDVTGRIVVALTVIVVAVVILELALPDFMFSVWLKMRYLPAQAIASSAARTLDHVNAHHQLRRWAFMLFVVGFCLDLLAS